MLSKASLFLAAATAHSHTFSPSQSARHSVCVALVWFPLHQGGGPKKETQYGQVRVQPGKRNTVIRVLLFRPRPGSCYLWCLAFHLTFVFALLPRKWPLSPTVHLSGRKATLLLLSWILSDD